MTTLTRRIDALEADGTSGGCIWIKMQSGESQEQAQARWLTENPDRRTDLEQRGTQLHFIRRVFVDTTLATQSSVGYNARN